VKGPIVNKGSTMSSPLAAISAAVLVAALSGCGINPSVDRPSQGVAAVNVPVIDRQDFAFDLSAPDGMLAAGEAARLDAWFRGLGLSYGDAVAVDGGAYAPSVRSDIGQLAGRYGLMVSDAAPVTAGAIAAGTVRVVVSRTRASVPGCPNWGEGGGRENWQNQSLPGFGCGVNTNMAAMVANPTDLIFGREGSGVVDTVTSRKAVDAYRAAPTTGAGGLKEISTKGGN
jgi:pilus assembly protein CpaD